MIPDSSVDLRVMGNAGMEYPIRCRHVQGVDRRWSCRVQIAIRVGLLLYVADARLHRKKGLVEPWAEILHPGICGQLSQPFQVVDGETHATPWRYIIFI